jgi:hypothetical protein
MWPANLVGAFFLALFVFDITQKNYDQILSHAIIGVLLTGIFAGLSMSIGDNLTGPLLLIPTTFAAVFLITIWFMNESIKKRGCCMKCSDSPAPQKKCKSTSPPAAPTAPAPKKCKPSYGLSVRTIV